jgi:hypothetical protein
VGQFALKRRVILKQNQRINISDFSNPQANLANGVYILKVLSGNSILLHTKLVKI